MARGPRMTPERFEKVKEMLQINQAKRIGWTFDKIGQLNGCSGDTVGRVNKSADYPEYCELLKIENLHRQESKERKKVKTMAVEQAEDNQAKEVTAGGLARAFADLCQSLDRLTRELKRLDHPAWLQTTLFGDLPKGE